MATSSGRPRPIGYEPITIDRSTRETYIDFLRAISLIVVVIWHWVFTVLSISETRVDANNPIGTTPGLWIATWVLQVLPLFFFVGGYAHLIVWNKVRSRGGGWATFVYGRLKRLVPAALGMAGVWFAIGALILRYTGYRWMTSAVVLIISPLWFLAVYLILVLLAPLAIWVHRRWGALALVFLLGFAAVFDTLRFAHGQSWAAWANFIVIWGFCHQLGLHYHVLVSAHRQVAWMLMWTGLFALIALTNFRFYPRSMVGVPGDAFSNMGPPTLVIGGLAILQAGIALLVRPAVMRRLESRRSWATFSELANRFSLPLYLFHTTGMAIGLAVVFLVWGYIPPDATSAAWWIQRPLWLILPAIVTAPLILGFGGLLTKSKRAQPVVPTGVAAADGERHW